MAEVASAGAVGDPKQALVLEHLPRVKQIALHLAARLPASVDTDDLIQVGLIGLLKASEDHDATRGASFATYAGIRIRGAMLDELRRHDWLPRSVQGKLRQVSEAITVVEQEQGQLATDEAIARQLALPVDEYRELAAELACARMTTLEELGGDDAVVSAEADPAGETARDAFRRALADAIARLPEREALMMSLYYSEGLNLREIAGVLEVTESRVSQLHGQAIARLRGKLSAWMG
jgi:RNA polymerase sigma factor for flagellar operon FliA